MVKTAIGLNETTPHLDPDFAADVAADRRGKARRFKQSRNFGKTARLRSVWFAQRKNPISNISNYAWRFDNIAGGDHASDNALIADGARYPGTWVDRLQCVSFQIAAVGIKVPEGYPVLRRDDYGVGADQRLHSFRGDGQGMGFGGQKNHVLDTQIAGSVGCRDVDNEFVVLGDYLQPIGLK